MTTIKIPDWDQMNPFDPCQDCVNREFRLGLLESPTLPLKYKTAIPMKRYSASSPCTGVEWWDANGITYCQKPEFARVQIFTVPEKFLQLRMIKKVMNI